MLSRRDALAAGLSLLQAGTGPKHGMCVAVSPPGADVGRDVLMRGGNAVDAAVAIGFAMAVTYPSAGNLGGGGFMVIHPPRGVPMVAEYREKAPAAARRTMYSRKDTWYSHKAAGVPGTVAGLHLAHKTFGKLPWKDVVAPAVGLAEDGFRVDAQLAGSLNWITGSFQVTPEMRRVYGKKDDWESGDPLLQPDLARTLRRIQMHGPAGFYKGDTAALIVKEMKAGNGLITLEDLANYKAILRKPIHGTYRGYDVYAPPPPSSGGICLAQMLNVLECFDLKERYSARTLHLLGETMKRAYRDRALHLGDGDFIKIPNSLASKEYGKKIAASIDVRQATPSEKLAPEIELAREGDNTTHFSVIDDDGMAVANTYTLERSYGSRIVVRGAGFLLNNEMIDFNWFPGTTTREGLIGTEANTIRPGKRMLSSQTPTIVSKGGKVFLVTGSPGSRSIINTSLCIVINAIDFGMDARKAVDAPRLHHQWFPDELRFEGAAEHPAVVEQLRKMGHFVVASGQGDAHTIRVNPRTGEYEGAADRRINGRSSGF